MALAGVSKIGLMERHFDTRASGDPEKGKVLVSVFMGLVLATPVGGSMIKYPEQVLGIDSQCR